MKKNILLRTNTVVCLVVAAGFLLTALLSYRANYSTSLESIEQVTDLTSEGIYYQMTTTFSKPINISLTMANDSLLKGLLAQEKERAEDPAYTETIQEYLNAYREKYGYDSVFLVSSASGRYYNFNGLDRVLTPGEPENDWYFSMVDNELDYWMNIDNDEVAGADNRITAFVDCKIHDEDGRVMGVVGVGLRVDYLQGLLQDYQDSFGVNAYLIDGDGNIQISCDHTGYDTVSLFEADRYDDELRGEILGWREEGSAHSFWTPAEAGDDARNYLVTRYLPELDWHLLVEQNTGGLMQELNRQLALTVAIILIILCAILYVITRVIRHFNKQIVELTQAVEQERQSVFEKATEQLYENIYELDITHNRPANRATEAYFASLGAPAGTPFDKGLQIIAQKQIQEEFRQGYIDTFSPENVLRAYGEGRETLVYDFMISTGGDYYWMRITARIVRWESDGSIHMLTYRQNIDAEKRREQQMRELAQTDEMTGLLTKTATQRRIDELMQQGQASQYAYFIFDIDNFKQANDLYGHAFGDGVIRRFSQTILQHFRHDDIAGRIGGDEFVAFVEIPSEDWAREKAKELSSALNMTYSADGKSWHISASIGLACGPGEGGSADSFYKKADSALYQAKERGKNGFAVYHP